MSGRVVSGVVASAVGLVLSVAMAAGLAYFRRGGFVGGELRYFGFWTSFFLAGLFVLAILACKWLADRRRITGLLFATLFGLMYGYLYTLATAAILGATVFMYMWSFDVLDCWAVAAVFGLLAATLFVRARNRARQDAST